MGKTYQPVVRYDNADYTTQDRGKLVVGDFNGDGKCDVSTLNFYSSGSGTMVNFMSTSRSSALKAIGVPQK